MANHKQYRMSNRKFKNKYNTCFYCLSLLNRTSKTIDHIVPVAKGGLSVLSNKVISCTECNRQKGDRNVFDFIHEKFSGNHNFDELRKRLINKMNSYKKENQEVFVWPRGGLPHMENIVENIR